jgi:excisionase family DNA binding protein
MSQDLLLLKEAQAYLRTSRSTIYRLMASGELQGHKVGSIWRFYKRDLDKVIRPEIPMPPVPVRVEPHYPVK